MFIILVGVIYHPPKATSDDNTRLYIPIQSVVDSYMRDHPDCLVWIVGDFNHTSTNISASHFKRTCGLTQIVKVLTRDTGILDWCLTSHPKPFLSPKQLQKLGSSDHYCFLVPPGILPAQLPIQRTYRRDSCIRAFGAWITAFSWCDLFSLESCLEKFEYFHRTLLTSVNTFLPIRSLRTCPSDKP